MKREVDVQEWPDEDGLESDHVTVDSRLARLLRWVSLGYRDINKVLSFLSTGTVALDRFITVSVAHRGLLLRIGTHR
jgi:hypothetical protein